MSSSAWRPRCQVGPGAEAHSGALCPWGLQLWGLPIACHLPCFLHSPAGLSAWQGAERDTCGVCQGQSPPLPCETLPQSISSLWSSPATGRQSPLFYRGPWALGRTVTLRLRPEMGRPGTLSLPRGGPSPQLCSFTHQPLWVRPGSWLGLAEIALSLGSGDPDRSCPVSSEGGW